MGRENIPQQVGTAWGKLLEPGGKVAEIDGDGMDQSTMDNAARSPLSPEEGTWSLLLSWDLISEQIRKCWSLTISKISGVKSSTNRT